MQNFFQNLQGCNNLIPNLTPFQKVLEKKLSTIFFFSENRPFHESTKKPILTFQRRKLLKIFWKVNLLQRLIPKNQWKLKTWCILDCCFRIWNLKKNSVQKLTSWKKGSWKFHSQLNFYSKTVFHCIFLLKIIHVNKTQNCQIWRLYIAKSYKSIFPRAKFSTKSDSLKKQFAFKICCIIKLLIRNLMLFAKLKSNFDIK